MPEMSKDESLGAYNVTTGIFTVPESGKYEMILTVLTINYATNSTSYYHEYGVDLKVDGAVVDRIAHKSNQVATRGNYRVEPERANQLISEIDLTKGQKVAFDVRHQYGNIYHNDGCMVNNKNVGCSYMQGKLLKRN